MTDRLTEIEARLDAAESMDNCVNCFQNALSHGGAVEDGFTSGPPPKCPEHDNPIDADDVRFLLERVRELGTLGTLGTLLKRSIPTGSWCVSRAGTDDHPAM